MRFPTYVPSSAILPYLDDRPWSRALLWRSRLHQPFLLLVLYIALSSLGPFDRGLLCSIIIISVRIFYECWY